MHTLVLKLTVTPVLILTASLASRRWGESIGGWFVGLPLTSGPVCFSWRSTREPSSRPRPGSAAWPAPQRKRGLGLLTPLSPSDRLGPRRLPSQASLSR